MAGRFMWVGWSVVVFCVYVVFFVFIGFLLGGEVVGLRILLCGVIGSLWFRVVFWVVIV